MKHYIIVLEMKKDGEKKVRKVIMSENIDSSNVENISQALSAQWISNSKMFPAPRYDIVIGICDELTNIEREIPKSRGWDSVNIETLATSNA
jgi:hypothetical protein